VVSFSGAKRAGPVPGPYSFLLGANLLATVEKAGYYSRFYLREHVARFRSIFASSVLFGRMLTRDVNRRGSSRISNGRSVLPVDGRYVCFCKPAIPGVPPGR